ncbi:ABC transporter permease [Pseudomonas atacamensis]|uniref:ABC transporter permease n=1 Tax=Pseudomonas atacamensis TaxID=2565368 RepID=UPI0021DB2B40|nr:ABC transporter permease [Pseudomonas atacamensis]
MTSNSIFNALNDIVSSAKRYSLVGMLGWADIKQRYRRSALGAFWLTVSMGVMIASIGLVFGQIFNTPMQEYLPFLSLGIVLWGFISSNVTEGCVAFTSAEAIIKQLNIPLFVHVLRCFWRNFIVLGHNIVIIPIAFLIVGKPLTLTMLLFVPGIILLSINLLWISLVLGVLSTRFRDITQIIVNATQVIFYLTPIMWAPSLLPSRHAAYLLNSNPVYHLLEITRGPILGTTPSPESWIFAIVMAVFGWLFAIVLYNRYMRRIPYWL